MILSYLLCKSNYDVYLLYLAPGDYEPFNKTLTFGSERSRHAIPVRIINDGVDEEDEQLLCRLQLEPVDGDSPNVQVQPNNATLVILDDDGKGNDYILGVKQCYCCVCFRNLYWL